MSVITSERVEQAVRVVSDAARKAAKSAIEDLAGRGVLNGDNFQKVLAQGDRVVSAVTVTVTELLVKLAENLVGRLKLISGGEKIVLAPTDGKGTLAKAKDVFYYIDSYFQSWGTDVVGKLTAETPVQVYEMIKDGTFAQIYGGFGENLDRLCLTQAQIVVFCRDHRNWLRTDGYGTFFLFKVGVEFFVARVFVYSDGDLGAGVDRLSLGLVWGAGCRHRFVIPQLALES